MSDCVLNVALALFGAALAAVYWPGISGAATSPRWAVSIVVIAPVLFMTRRIQITSGHLVGIVFVLWCALSYLWTAKSFDAIGALWKLTILSCAYCLGSMLPSTVWLYRGAALGLGVSSIIAIMQWCGYSIIPDVTSVTGLFVNPIILGEAAALVGAVC